ncbi:hypothetical protein ABZZ04_31535 [Streptomyces sp. NPDC006435]|uniref:hypothetical protein n=1 Tax=Streptomyces sp. NPDC006435 TaxID=3154300 RepID=UPI0033AF17BD
MNIKPLLEALDVQEEAARTQANALRAQVDNLQTRLRKAEIHLEHIAITRKTVTGLADRFPASRRNCPSIRTTPASSPCSTRRPDHYGPS